MASDYGVLVDWTGRIRNTICAGARATRARSTRGLWNSAGTDQWWIATLIAKHPADGLRCAWSRAEGGGLCVDGLCRGGCVCGEPGDAGAVPQGVSSQRAKDDPSDAALALDLLERHRDGLKLWHPDTPATRLLRRPLRGSA